MRAAISIARLVAQSKGMEDLVELQVPKLIILQSETITKDNVKDVVDDGGAAVGGRADQRVLKAEAPLGEHEEPRALRCLEVGHGTAEALRGRENHTGVAGVVRRCHEQHGADLLGQRRDPGGRRGRSARCRGRA